MNTPFSIRLLFSLFRAVVWDVFISPSEITPAQLLISEVSDTLDTDEYTAERGMPWQK